MALPAGAHGASYNRVCESGEICLFAHANFSGEVLFDRYAVRSPTGPCWREAVGSRGYRASSFANRWGGWGQVTAWSGVGLIMHDWEWAALPDWLNDNVRFVSNGWWC